MTSHRASTAAAIRSRTFAISRPGCRAAPADTARLFPGRRRARRDSREPALCARPRSAEDFPNANFSGGSGLNFTSQDPDQPEAPRRPAPHGLPGHQQLAGHRPLHEQQGRHPAGVRDDVGRQRQRPAPDADAVRAPRLELHAVGDRHPELVHVARIQLGTRRELAELPTPAGAAVPQRHAGVSGLPLLFPDALQADYVPWFRFRAGAPATPASTRPIAVRSPTRTSPTTSSRT